MNRWITLSALGVLSVASLVGSVQAGEDAAAASKEKPAVKHASAYLGLGIAPLPESLASHLSQSLEEGRGVLVVDVPHDSPAAKAGLKPHDILVSYDEQKLYSSEQLVKLVHNDQVGRAVTVGYVRAGKTETVKLTLGEQPHAAPKSSWHLPQWFQHRQQPQSQEERAQRWRTFDSLSLTRLDEHRFKAEVKFRDDQGKVETHAYEGTHDEIRKAIEAEKHLPANERRHLLRALDLPDHPLEFPGFHLVPGGDVHWDFEESAP